MDYTLHELRPLIYKDKEDIGCFNVDDEKSLDAAMLKLIEESSIIVLDGANKYILEIFNNAYYITTLILMEKRPIQFFRSYLTISEHTGSSSDDISGRNTFFEEFSSFTMAMVCNYLRLLDDKYNDEDNLFIKKLTEHFKKFFKPTSTKEDAYSIFTSNLMSLEVLNNYNVDRNSFAPRKIDEQAINDTKEHFRRKYSSWSEMITNCDFKSNDNFIKGICRTEEEKTILAAAFRKEEIVSTASNLMNNVADKFSELNIEKEQLQARIKELAAQVEELQQKLKSEDEEKTPANAYEKIIFFATVLSAAYDAGFTHQQELSEFICTICGGSPKTFQPRISKLSSMAATDKYDQEVINAAQKIVERLKKVPKGGDKDNPKILEIINSIECEFNLRKYK